MGSAPLLGPPPLLGSSPLLPQTILQASWLWMVLESRAFNRGSGSRGADVKKIFEEACSSNFNEVFSLLFEQPKFLLIAKLDFMLNIYCTCVKNKFFESKFCFLYIVIVTSRKQENEFLYGICMN